MLTSRKEGAIINTSSILSYVPLNLGATYSASKEAMHFYTVSLRDHLKILNSKVKVFELLPPVVATSMTENFETKAISPEKLVNALIAGIKKDRLPRQVVEMRSLEFEEDGYILVMHEDFLNGHALHEDIQWYSFFEYETNEALHLTPKEEKIIWNIFNSIEQEYNNSEDEFSKEIILAGITSMLKYAERFYKRQFINRKQLSGKTVTEFNKILQNYIKEGSLDNNRLPSVGEFAGRLNISSKYLTDLLKVETGKTAIELIHIALIGEAKNRLIKKDKTVSEIAYELGFESMSYFSRLFKKETGMLPSSYKKQFVE